MGGTIIIGIKSIAKLAYMMNEDGSKKGKNYYGRQKLLDYNKFIMESKINKVENVIQKKDYNIDFGELAEEFIAEYINE
jgi:hypothetical protein